MVLGGNEFHVEGMGLVLQVLEAAGGGAGVLSKALASS